ncbi:MAG: hypothetical protein U5K33_11205 [Halofilum sp. (in: g-proteobacteria)]|nr:hypothetical protein [Halofilum sp. (in: g-proteobacteria)]
MEQDSGILLAWRLHADGAVQLAPGEAAEWKTGDGALWVHLDRTRPGTRAWLRDVAQLDPFIVDTLLEEETRPRVLAHDGGTVVNLRGVISIRAPTRRTWSRCACGSTASV